MTILIEKENNGVTRIFLNRPEVHNAFNEQMISDLTDAFEELENCQDTRVVILSGKGKSFSAGADLKWMKAAANYSYDDNIADAQRLSNMLNALYSLKHLTIASIHGAIMGGGLGLVSCADIVVADKNCKFSFSEVKLGLIPATISPFVIEAIGVKNAKRYFQTAEIFGAKKAHQMGLISEFAESKRSRDKLVSELAHQTLLNAPEAVLEAKRLVGDVGGRIIDDLLRQNSAERIADIRAKEEAKEGLTAFFEKRKPGWVSDV